MTVDAELYRHQVWAAIVTERSLTDETLASTFLAFLRNSERRTWPNLYADVNGTMTLYLTADAGITPEPKLADRLLVTIPGEGSVPPFVELLADLANYLRVAPLIDYSPTAYLPHYSGPVRSWPITDAATLPTAAGK